MSANGSNVAIGWDNHINTAVVTASSEISSLPATNLQTPDIREIWRCQSINSHILADFGGQVLCGGTLLANSNLDVYHSARVRLSTADATGVAGDAYDSFSHPCGVDPTYGIFLHLFNATGRYLRIDMTHTTAKVEAGRWFAGPVWIPTRGFQYGWAAPWIDTSRKTESLGQITYVDRRMAQRGLRFKLPSLTEDEAFDQVFQLNRVAGSSQDIFVCRNTASSNVSRDTVWGLLDNPAPYNNPAYGHFDAEFTLRERL